jgi:hypothetical protein
MKDYSYRFFVVKNPVKSPVLSRLSQAARDGRKNRPLLVVAESWVEK